MKPTRKAVMYASKVLFVWVVGLYASSWFVFDVVPTLPLWVSVPSSGFVFVWLVLSTGYVCIVGSLIVDKLNEGKRP